MNTTIPPFEMHKNIFFVGSRRVSVHVFKTSAGLVMLDTGYPDMYDEIIDNMQSLGLDPKDLCAIFHSHGHIDHFGCTQKLKAISGAKTYISRIDNEIINGNLNLSWADEANYTFTPFTCDVLIGDGDSFTIGDITIRCRLTPGHTDGTLSFFITMQDGIIAAMHGGLGKNTMTRKFLEKYNLSPSCMDVFREGLHKLVSEHVDLVLGNHAGQNDTEGKLAKVLAGQSALDKTEWKAFLERQERNLDAHRIKEGF